MFSAIVQHFKGTFASVFFLKTISHDVYLIFTCVELEKLEELSDRPDNAIEIWLKPGKTFKTLG